MLEIRYAVRTLLRTPFVSAVAIASLALGIGANAAIFSLFDQMLLRRLPVDDPGALVNLTSPGPRPGSISNNSAGFDDSVFSYPMFRDLERQQTVFSGLAAHRLFDANLAYRGETLSGDGVFVSGSYFPLLRLRPVLGRLLSPDDDHTPGAHSVAVLSYDYWRARFGGRRDVVGEALVVNGRPLTIVGVAPAGFTGTTLGARPQLFVPISMREELVPGWKGLVDRRSYWVYLFGRLKPGVSLEQAQAGINRPYRAILNDVEAALQSGSSPQTLERFRAKEIALEPGARGQSTLGRNVRGPLLLLLGVAGFVLLIACANIANLLLARGAARSAEMAVRLSMGASRGRLVAQLLVESCVLGLLGGLAGVLVAQWTLQLLGSLLPSGAAEAFDFEVDRSVLLVAAALSLGTGIIFGLFPALHSTRSDLVSALKGQAGQPGGGRSAARFRVTLATAQIALAMTLLVSAGLFIRSLVNISRVDLGIRTSHLVTFRVSPELNGYTPGQSLTFFDRLEDEIGALPGVVSVAGSMVPLIAGDNWGNNVSVEGFDAAPDADTNARYNVVGPGYFATLEIPVLSGREFTRRDAGVATKVAIVNETFARRFGLGQDAVGRHMGLGRTATLEMEIVGLVQDAKYSDVKDEVPPQFFMPFRQLEGIGTLNFYVRTERAPEPMLATIAAVVKGLDENLPIENARTMEMQVHENVSLDRLIGTLSSAFALLATLLAAIGLYGVLAYTVAQRTREIGLRMALGADASRIRRLVLRQVALMVAVGGVVGLAAALALGRVARSLLFELEAHDPGVLAVAAVLLSAVALGAGFIPAHRASRVEPMRALRYE